MTRESIAVTRDWAASPRKSAVIRVTTYTNGVANPEKTIRG